MALIVVAAMSLAGHAFAAPPAVRPLRDLFGVNVKFAQGQPIGDLSLLSDLGVRWVRDTALWTDIEQKPGQYSAFPADFQRRLDFYKQHDIGLCFGLWYENPKAYPITPQTPFTAWDADAYGRYAGEIAKRLKASGVRFVIELWNEPHNTMKNFGGQWNGEPPSPWLDQYVTMVHTATAAVKAVDPSIHVLVNDDMWVLHYRFLEKGLPKEVDGLAVHPYVKSWPEFSATEPDTTWTKPFVTVDADRSLKSAVRRLRDYGTAKLGHPPAMWITEWGWPLGEPIRDRPMTEEMLAGLIPRAYLTAADAGVETLLWFSMVDSVDGPMGLTSNDRKMRLTYQSFKTMTKTLGTGTAIEHVVGDDHPTNGLQVYRVDRPEGPVWIAWNIDGEATVITRGLQDATDVLGKAVTIDRTKTDDIRLPIGRSPLYLTGRDVVIEAEKRGGVSPHYLFP